MKLQVDKISLSEFDQLEKQVFDNDQTFDQMFETWQSLDQFFHTASYETDAEFRLTYFRLYVRLTWKMLTAIDKDYFVDVVRRQVLIVMISDLDVVNEIMWYLGFNSADRKALESLYLELKNAFLESQAVIGVWQGKNVTVAEIVKEINSIDSSGDSLAQADFESRLRQIMFPADEVSQKYLTADPEQAKDQFLDLISFFQTFTQENIWFVVDAFLNPEKYQGVAPGEAAPESTSTVVAPGKFTVPETIRPSAPPAAVSKPVAPAQSAPVKPTPVQIKSQIEKEFSTEDVEGIMSKLSELAEKNNDPKIAEMYYFDEKENKFKWNI